MKLIDEIIDLLSGNAGDLTDALIKTKVLLHKIGHKELVGWVNSELNGYTEANEVPPYRVFRAQVLANMTNMAYQFNSHPIPTMHLDGSYRESLETAKMSESIAVLEKFVANNEGSLRQSIPMEANRLLEKGLAEGLHIQQAWSEIQLSSVTSILTQVRSRLLDFLLELNENFKGELTDAQVTERAASTDAESMFDNAIFGDNATIIVGSGNVQKISAQVIRGDFASISGTLAEHGVSEPDILDLKAAIATDAADGGPTDKEFGGAVKAWLQRMLSKAVDASWQIELGIASSLLANTLQRFYGWM